MPTQGREDVRWPPRFLIFPLTCGRFTCASKRWRSSHARRVPIPDSLGGGGRNRSARVGLNPTSKALHLEYGKLKQRAEAAVPTVKTRMVKARQRAAPCTAYRTADVCGTDGTAEKRSSSADRRGSRKSPKKMGVPPGEIAEGFWRPLHRAKTPFPGRPLTCPVPSHLDSGQGLKRSAVSINNILPGCRLFPLNFDSSNKVQVRLERIRPLRYADLQSHGASARF